MKQLEINFNRIDVNDYNALNGTTVHYKDNRYICIYQYPPYCGMATCFLDFIDGKYYYVNNSTYNLGNTGFVDSRIVKYNNEYFVSNTNFTQEIQTMHLMRLFTDGEKSIIDFNNIMGFPTIYNFSNYSFRNEKNWCPFEYDGKFYYIYSLNPHRFIEVDIYSTGSATLKYETDWYTNSWWNNQQWEEPKYRLNTSPIKLSDGTYLSTFHTMNFSNIDSSCNEKVPQNIRSYWTGFYQFEGKPPFRVKRISSFPAISANLQFSNDWPKQTIRTTANPFFPFNMFLNGENLIMTGGSNDVCLAYCSIKLEDVLQSLENVVDFSINY